jgi:predicted HNH restriction endonuclease
MPYREIIKICNYCNSEFQTRRHEQKFCSHKCAGFGNNAMRGKSVHMTLEQKQKLSESIKNKWQLNPEAFSSGEKHSKAVGKSTKGKYKSDRVDSLFEVSSRTKYKILKRLKIGCSLCGWNESVCDLHHINGRKIPNCHNHNNLTYVCPNCHRKIHDGLVESSAIVTLEQQIGNKWRDEYYG